MQLLFSITNKTELYEIQSNIDRSQDRSSFFSSTMSEAFDTEILQETEEDIDRQFISVYLSVKIRLPKGAPGKAVRVSEILEKVK